jgi:hypothetical protein
MFTLCLTRGSKIAGAAALNLVRISQKLLHCWGSWAVGCGQISGLYNFEISGAIDNRAEAKFILWLICLRYKLLANYDNIYRIGGSNYAP